MAAEFNERSCGGEGVNFRDLLLSVAKDESFEIGLLLVVYFALRCYGDKHLEFFVQGREWFFHDQVGPMFFAVEDDG